MHIELCPKFVVFFVSVGDPSKAQGDPTSYACHAAKQNQIQSKEVSNN